MQGKRDIEHIDDLRGFPPVMVDFDDGSFENSPPSMVGSWALSAVAFLIGAVLLMLANGDFGAVILAFLFLVAGLIIHVLPGLRNPYARRAFLLSYSICVLVMGVSQMYAQVLFETVQTTVDSSTFYNLTRLGMWRESLEDFRSIVNAPLPVIIWRVLYTVASPLGNAPYIGILLNSFIVGMAGSITIRAGRYLTGDNPRSLCRLGNLFAACGLFWLFGAIFLRDSFALFLNVVVLYACLRFLALPCLKNVIVLGVLVVFSALCMNYVREGTILLFVLLLALAVFSWTRRHRGSIFTFLFPPIALFLVFLFLPLISSYSTEVAGSLERGAIRYGSEDLVSGSLGSAMVVTQPMPVRIPAGSLYLLVNPIPLWTYFDLRMPEYHWIKGWQGLFLVCVVPSAFIGLVMALKQAFRGGSGAPAPCFVAFYAIITTMAIAATSLETRHHGQFLPATLMLASLPNKNNPVIRRMIRLTMLIWFAVVIIGHIMWFGLKFF